jgi:hypothetical protein
MFGSYGRIKLAAPFGSQLNANWHSLRRTPLRLKELALFTFLRLDRMDQSRGRVEKQGRSESIKNRNQNSEREEFEMNGVELKEQEERRKAKWKGLRRCKAELRSWKSKVGNAGRNKGSRKESRQNGAGCFRGKRKSMDGRLLLSE